MERKIIDIVADILEIIEYPDDREQFLKEFQQTNHEEAIFNILEQFPEDIKEKIKNAEDPNLIKDYITEEAYLSEMTKVSEEALKNFLETINSSLSDEQREKIEKLFQNLAEPQSNASAPEQTTPNNPTE